MNLKKTSIMREKVYSDNPRIFFQISESLFASGLMNQLFVYSQFQISG